ncbi:fungal-specific transcription factor domain-containing protein [Aspergillus pseudoustus]|uniref:Fungal-specific transcription factor domain-containing protein n=1 Tax=Aspergillus pseudoustus TaxID=1810923 RepID=A0ABR4L0D0_9EURO
MVNDTISTPIRLSRNRKSRGRGLRTTTGCSTCRKRHLKCDEVKPVCGPCLKVSRQCIYSQLSDLRSRIEPSEKSPQEPAADSFGESLQEPLAEPLEEASEGPIEEERPAALAQPSVPLIPSSFTGVGSDQSPVISSSHEPPNPSILPWPHGDGQPPLHPLDQLAAIVAIDHTTSPQRLGNGLATHYSSDIPSVTSSIESPRLTVNTATVRWFDLLANDAIRESPQIAGAGYGEISSLERLDDIDASQITPLQRATRIVDRNLGDVDTHPIDSPVGSSYEEALWQAQEPIQLLPREYSLFENFVQRVSPWIDLFDPTNKFSTFVPHLAMRNAGLLNAILALSSRHLSLNPEGPAQDHQPHRETSLQYYYQTLHYVQKAMQYSSYKTSLELLATTLIISTYEMLDDSSQDWQRHLEGVFLIQRSQVIHGDSGGLKSAVWWAWLCQDVWAAFRERRKTLTFWVPKKTYASLSPAEIASRSMFVLAKVINYCSQEESLLAEINLQERIDRAKHLRNMLDEWWAHRTVEFSPLPAMTSSTSAPFRPIWIRTPAFAVAVQLHCVAHILICSHEPCLYGVDQFMERQTSIRQCVEIICGIAMALKDDGSSLISSQCLFIAGMFTQDSRSRECVLDLLGSCRERTGWPVHSFGNELKQLWKTYKSHEEHDGAGTYASILMNNR